MKLITSRVGSYLTGSEIADAVIRYGLALARNRELDIVDIPFVSRDGSVLRAQFTVGWQVETATISRTEPGDELTEPATAQVLNQKADHVGVNAARPFTPQEVADLVSIPLDLVESC